MKKEIKTINKINAPIDTIWKYLRTGEGVNHWLPIVTACEVDGNRRFCTIDGNQLDETILKSDDAEKTFEYSIDEQNLFPISDIKGQMQLSAINEEQTTLFWNLAFTIEQESLYPEIKEGITKLYQEGAKGLEKIAQSTITNY